MSANTVFILVNGTENSVLISGTLTQTDVDPYRTDLSGVIIGTAVTSIGNYAFLNCSNLNTAIIGSNVTTMSEGVFYNCSNLTTISIPDSVTL
jgi:hypothetical protein